jgi:hypothetical protein
MRLPGRDFKSRMAGKRMWAISCYSDEDRVLADPLFATLHLTAQYMRMWWGGSVLGKGNRPGDVLSDSEAVTAADELFRQA